MSTDNIEDAEILEDVTIPADDSNIHGSDKDTAREPIYPDGWKAETRSLWNGAILTGMLILLCAALIFFFPQGGIGEIKSPGVGIGTMLVYFLILTITTLTAINTYQKGLTRFAMMFAKDGGRALDVIRWGFMLTVMGVVFHFFIFYLPFIDPATKHLTSTLLIGNSILILAAATSIVGFLMLATAKGCPDPSRKGALWMIPAALVLLLGAFVAPKAVDGSNLLRIVELALLVAGCVLFLISWRRITKS